MRNWCGTLMSTYISKKIAWTDTEFSIKWAEQTIAKSVTDLKRYVLFLDNLTAQETEAFKKTVADLKGVLWYGLKNATDLWQVIDAGLTQMMKILMVHQHRSWLDQEENAESWYGHGTSYSASERRILISRWVGEAWNVLSGPDYNHLRRRCWEKADCLITAGGSVDDKISPEGLSSYQVPPPVGYLPATETLPTPNEASRSDDTTNFSVEEEFVVEEFGQEEPENEGREFADHESESILHHIVEEKCVYFNEHLQKYSFDDSSEDYIGDDDIDMNEVCVV